MPSGLNYCILSSYPTEIYIYASFCILLDNIHILGRLLLFYLPKATLCLIWSTVYNIYVSYSSKYYTVNLRNTDFMPSKCTAKKPKSFLAEKEQKSVEVGLVSSELNLDVHTCYHSYSV